MTGPIRTPAEILAEAVRRGKTAQDATAEAARKLAAEREAAQANEEAGNGRAR